MSVGILLLTHAGAASPFAPLVQRLLGRLPLRIECFELEFDADLDTALPRASTALRRADDGDGVLILTDLFGDTPSNLALGLVDPGRVEVVTGVNLPMVLRLACLDGRAQPLAELARWIQAKGRQGIRVGTPVGGALVGETA